VTEAGAIRAQSKLFSRAKRFPTKRKKLAVLVSLDGAFNLPRFLAPPESFSLSVNF
jgi:hypothetical protein